jgi:hypothetical protein
VGSLTVASVLKEPAAFNFRAEKCHNYLPDYVISHSRRQKSSVTTIRTSDLSFLVYVTQCIDFNKFITVRLRYIRSPFLNVFIKGESIVLISWTLFGFILKMLF